METLKLNVTETSYATAKAARAANRIPVAYYAKGIKNRGFSVDYQDFRRAFQKGGRSTILYFVNEKKEEMPVLVHELQYDPVSDLIIHVDVKAVDMTKKIRTKIPVKTTGISPAVRDLAGVLVLSKDAIEVECLPKDLVHEFVIDVSALVDFHTSIKVRDIQVPVAIKVLDDGGIAVATVAAPRPTAEEEAAKAATEAAAAGVVPAAEGAAPAEGAAAPAAEGAKKEEAAAKPAGKPAKK